MVNLLVALSKPLHPEILFVGRSNLKINFKYLKFDLNLDENPAKGKIYETISKSLTSTIH